MMPKDMYMGILQVHIAQGAEILVSNLHDKYIQLGYSLIAAKSFVREQGLDRPDKLRVLTDKNVDDIYNVMRKPGGKNAN